MTRWGADQLEWKIIAIVVTLEQMAERMAEEVIFI